MDIASMMQQAQQMQANMQRMQEELAQTEFEYEGNGVKVIVTGDLAIVSINIEEDLIKSAVDDKEMLEDCIQVAITGAMKKAKDEVAAQTASLTGGLNIPGLNL